jgi:hypothetical protein
MPQLYCRPKLIASFLVVYTLFFIRAAEGQNWSDGQAASHVIGQTGFGTNGSATSSTTLYTPTSVTEDPATGKVFVSDQFNHRVLRYPSAAAMTNGAAAEAVLGQSSFTTNASNTAANGLYYPTGVAVDAAGNLWVGDVFNNRVLRFANAATFISGASAAGVLGQSGFTTSAAAVSQSGMNNPTGVFVSGTTLWVVDVGNNRILRFDNAAAKANGGPADAVIGQPGFTTGGTSTPSASNLNHPLGLYVAANNLWVADADDNRVLKYPDATGFTNGASATVVLGQTAFTAAGANTTSGTMSQPTGVYGDGEGNLYVADAFNSRVLIYKNAASVANGSAASYVLGQSSFTTNATGDGASNLNNPASIYVGTDLLVADRENNRVVIYDPLVPLPLTLTAFTARLQSNGQVQLQWEVSGAGGSAGAGGAPVGTFELDYATSDTSGLNTVLNTQADEASVDDYSYFQVSPAPGINYYRLKLILPDGSATYSAILTVVVNASSAGSTGLGLYPNPARTSLTVKLPQSGASSGAGASTGASTSVGASAGAGTSSNGAALGAGGIAVILVYNSAGVLVDNETTADAVHVIDISRLAASVYTVKVVQGGHATTGTFVKAN